MQMNSVRCLSPHGFHRMAYRTWGPATAERTLLCVHGLSRNGRDFDAVAETLAEAGWRVVCPDVVGRGESDWPANPAVYNYPQYLADMTVLMARLEVERIDWLGTSMGGLIGMQLAAQPGSPIGRLILNDVGPFIAKAALERIGGYILNRPHFESLEAAEVYAKETYAPFGRNLSDAQWRKLTEVSFRALPDGGYGLNYDAGIAKVFEEKPVGDLDLWALWDAISQPTLVLHGAESDLLLPDTVAEMQRRGPKADAVTFADCGHAPSLMEVTQIKTVAGWLG